MKKGLILFGLIIAINSSASNMANSYDQGKAHAAQHNNDASNAVSSTSLANIPYYQGSNPQEVKLHDEISDLDDAANYALSNPAVREDYDTVSKTRSTLPQINQTTLNTAESIASNPEQYLDGEAYCADGGCTDLVDEPNEEMIQTTAVLEDVLGGGNNYSQTGTTIYGGKGEKCQDMGWGFADCCTDEGWGVDLNLMSCPEDTKALGKKKEDGKCHYLGNYKEKIRVAGVVVRVDKYKGYCCYSSKMARVTQEGAKPQLGKTWESPKHPQCEGLTTDEFSRLDFAQINLTGVYGDIEQKSVDANQNEMLSTPEGYYDDMGVK